MNKQHKAVLFLCAAALFGGCTVPFDQDFEEPINTVDSVIALIGDRPGLAAAGDDYLYMAPVSIWHARGTRHYLWIARSSSIDRELRGITLPDFETVTLVVDEQLMELQLAPWESISRTTPYQITTPLYGVKGVRVTVSQLERLANAKHIEAFIDPEKSTPQSFALTAVTRPDWSDLGVFNTASND